MKKQKIQLGLVVLIFSLFAFSANAQVKNNKLTIYTYDSFMAEWAPGPKIKQDFEKNCKCELDFKVFNDGVSLLNRLKLEGTKTKADIILGLDNNLFFEAKKTQLLAKHNIEPKMLTKNLNNMPINWQDEYFIPYDYGYFAFVYDKTKLKNPPKSMAELVKRQDIKIIYQDSRSSTPGLGLLLWIKKIYGEKAVGVWQSLAKKTVNVSKGWSEAYALFLKGEADMVLSYTTSPAYHLIYEKDDRYVAAIFDEGHYLQIEGLAKTIKAKNSKLADKFINFALAKDFQTSILGNIMYPVAKIDMPKAFSQLAKPNKVLAFESEFVAKNRDAWIQEWLNAVSAK